MDKRKLITGLMGIVLFFAIAITVSIPQTYALTTEGSSLSGKSINAASDSSNTQTYGIAFDILGKTFGNIESQYGTLTRWGFYNGGLIYKLPDGKTIGFQAPFDGSTTASINDICISFLGGPKDVFNLPDNTSVQGLASFLGISIDINGIEYIYTNNDMYNCLFWDIAYQNRMYKLIVDYDEHINITCLTLRWTDNIIPETDNSRTYTYRNCRYSILSPGSNTVALIEADNNKNVTVPAVVIIDGEIYKVTEIREKAFTGPRIRTVYIGKNVKLISSKAFAGSSVKKIIIRSKKLTKKSVRGSLRRSKAKIIKVKVGNKSLNRKYMKKYRSFFTKKNAGKKVNVII